MSSPTGVFFVTNVPFKYGDIRLESEEGKGSTFTVTLPVEYAPLPEAADPDGERRFGIKA